MSGQPSKQPRFDPYGRSQATGQTERAPRRQTRQPEPEPDLTYDEYPPYEEEAWTEEYPDDGYVDDTYEEPAAPPARQRRAQPTSRQRVPQEQPEFYEDDLYEDPYLIDEGEPEERPQRPVRRPSRARGERQAPSFSIPPAITEAPVVKDRITLGMMAVLLVSMVAMLIVVATRNDELGGLIFTHVNANGEAEDFKGAGAAWNMPLIAGMVTLINGVLAWFISRWGMFLPRFLLGGAIGVNFMVWVALFGRLF